MLVTRSQTGPARPACFAAASLAAIGAAALLATSPARERRPSGPAAEQGTSVVILIGDGMGPVQRAAIQYTLYGKTVRQPIDDFDHFGCCAPTPRAAGSPPTRRLRQPRWRPG